MNILFKFVFIGLVTPLLSVSAPPFPFEVDQPDGSKIPVRIFGHEYYNWMETEDGYVIDWVEDDTHRGWYYSKLDGYGKFTSSEILVTFPAPYDLYIPKRLREISPKVRDMSYKLPITETDSHNHLNRGILDNTLKPLVFLVNFSDEDHEFTEDHFHNLLFVEDLSPTRANFPSDHDDYTMSVRDYYDEISNGKQKINGDIKSIVPWRTATHEYSYYVDGENGTGTGTNGNARSAAALVVEIAMAIDDEGFDFTPFDNGEGFIDVVILIVSGKGGQQSSGNHFWPHMFVVPTSDLNSEFGLENINPNAPVSNSGYFSPGGINIYKYIVIQERYAWNHPGTGIDMLHPIGTICHELGHVLGLPDLYDNLSPAAGIGFWGLMGSGNYLRQTSPAYMSAWSRHNLGFIVPDTLSEIYNLEITIPPAEGLDVGAAYILPMSSNLPQEYLMIENRQKEGSDKHLIKSGLLVWHIDENMTDMYPVFSTSVNIDPYYYGVNLLQADGYGNLYINDEGDGDSGDPFPGSTGKRRITSTTNPNTNLYQYDRNADGYSDKGGKSNISLTNITENSDKSITLTANNPNQHGIIVAYDEQGYGGWRYNSSNLWWAGIRMVAPENSQLSQISTVFPSSESSEPVRGYTINIWKGWIVDLDIPKTLLSTLYGVVNWDSDPDNIRNGGWANISIADSNIILNEGETYYIEIHFHGAGYIYPFDYGYFANSELSGMSYFRLDTQNKCESFSYGDWNIRVSLNSDFCNTDCNGTCNGTAEFDDCGVCGGDGICDGGGCMDIDACNYFSDATFDDGSCVYAEQNNQCNGNCSVEIDCTGKCGGNADIDECGQCDGPGAIYECGCVAVNEDISCDCDGNILDCDGICGGNNADCDMVIKKKLIPGNFILYQNYPNPFNPSTTISFSIPEFRLTTITVYDINGRKLETLTNEALSIGNYSINWNASSYPSGVYLIRMESGEFTQTQKVVLVK